MVPEGSASPRASLPSSASTMGTNHLGVSEPHLSFPFFLVFAYLFLLSNLGSCLWISQIQERTKTQKTKVCLFMVLSTYVEADSGSAVWPLMAFRERERILSAKILSKMGTNKLNIIVQTNI